MHHLLILTKTVGNRDWAGDSRVVQEVVHTGGVGTGVEHSSAHTHGGCDLYIARGRGAGNFSLLDLDCHQSLLEPLTRDLGDLWWWWRRVRSLQRLAFQCDSTRTRPRQHTLPVYGPIRAMNWGQ